MSGETPERPSRTAAEWWTFGIAVALIAAIVVLVAASWVTGAASVGTRRTVPPSRWAWPPVTARTRGSAFASWAIRPGWSSAVRTPVGVWPGSTVTSGSRRHLRRLRGSLRWDTA